MNGIIYDASKKGLKTVLRNWQIKALQAIWNNLRGMKSRARITEEELKQAFSGKHEMRHSD